MCQIYYKLVKNKSIIKNIIKYNKNRKKKGLSIIKRFDNITLFKKLAGKKKNKIRNIRYKCQELLKKDSLYNTKYNILQKKILLRLKYLKKKKVFFYKKLFFFNNQKNIKVSNYIWNYRSSIFTIFKKLLKKKLNKNLMLKCFKPYNFYLYKESFIYYNRFSSYKNIFFKNFLMRSIHSFTGYKNININFKPLYLDKFNIKDMFYKKLSEYTLYIFKFGHAHLSENDFMDKSQSKKFVISFLNDLLGEWSNTLNNLVFKLGFYDRKLFKKFFVKIFYFFSIIEHDERIKFKYFSEFLFYMFKYIYKKKKKHFKHAFTFFKLLIYRFYYGKYFPYDGIKIIAKGRFGKNRKQISRLKLGFLKLSSISKVLYYSNNLMITKRGTYGFHIWCSYKDKCFKILMDN
jgi:hypothetical protein